MANPTAVIFTDANGKVLTPIGATSGAQAAAPTPVVLCDANGNALSFTGALPLPSGSTATTQAPLDNSTKVATTAYADAAVTVETSRATTAEGLKAPLASPALTGTPTAPTATSYDNSTKLATTTYADNLIKGFGSTGFHEDWLGSFGNTAVTVAVNIPGDAGAWAALQIVAQFSFGAIAGTFANPGVLSLITGAVSGNGGALYRAGGTTSVATLGNLQANANWEMNFFVNLVSAANVCVRMGAVIAGQNAADAPTGWLGCEFDTATANSNVGYTLVGRSAGTSSVAGNTVAPNTAAYDHIRIFSTVAGTIQMSINGANTVSVTGANVPNAAVGLFFQTITRTAAAKTVNWDAISYMALTGRV